MHCYVITRDGNFPWAIKDAGVYDGVQTIFGPDLADKDFNSYIYSMTTDTYDKILDAREKLDTSDWYCVFENQYNFNKIYDGSIGGRLLRLYQNDLTILNIYNEIMTDIVNQYGWTEIYWCPQSIEEVPPLFVAGITKDFLTFTNFRQYAYRMFGEKQDHMVFTYLLAISQLNDIPVTELIDLL